MSRLYAVAKTSPEVADYFGVMDPPAIDVPSETVEGNPGVVVLESHGRRLLKAMTWGFPRLTREMRLRGDPPGRVGMVAELANPMWEHMVVDPRYRCLIPITHFANPDGEPGAKTRTWFSVADAPLLAWAGFCRNTPEFGSVYAGMTMAANAAVVPLNDRMPVLIEQPEFERWLHGPIADVIGFQFRAPIAAERMRVERTDDRWRSGKPPAVGQPQLALL